MAADGLTLPDANLVRQYARPSGVHAETVARFMNLGNGRLNALVVEALAPQAGEAVLDVGFGGGVSLDLLLETPAARVTAVDASEEIVALAREAFAPELEQGWLTVVHAQAEALPLPDATFEAAMSVNSLYFWTDPTQGLRELRRVLRPGGRVVFGLRAPESLRAARLDALGYHLVEPPGLVATLEGLGFVEVDLRPGDDPASGGAWLVRARRGR